MSKRTNIERVAGCPFCGKTPTVKAWNDGGQDNYMVVCSNTACPATSAVTGGTRDGAIRRWNIRKPVPDDGMSTEDRRRDMSKHYYCEDEWYSCPKHPDGCANDRLGPDCNCGEDMDTIIIPDGTKVPIFDVRIDTTKGVYQVAADMPSQAARALVRHLGKPWTKYRVEVTDHRGFSYYFTATITPHINLEEV